MKTVFIGLRSLLVLTLVTGVAYPLFVWGVAQRFFPAQAHGSLVIVNGQPVGSVLVGQKFESPRYFNSRPSASHYTTLPAGGSNLGPTSKALYDAIAIRRTQWGPQVPADLLTASGSGLDPHISPEAARYQIDRVAQARHLDTAQRAKLLSVVLRHTTGKTGGWTGEPRVNVLVLNLNIDKAFGK